RWTALFPVHRSEIQSRRHSTAVLGARWVRLSCRAPAWWPRLVVLTRPRLGRSTVGKIFRRGAGGALRAVHAVRPPGTPRFQDAGAVARSLRRANRRSASHRLAVSK